MTRSRRVLITGGVLVVLGACSEDVAQLSAPERPLFSVSSGTLVVTISNPFYIETGGTVNIKATASGGSGKYKFRWLRRICNRISGQPTYCEPAYRSEIYPVTTSGSTSTVAHKFLTTDVKTSLVVEVQDSMVAQGPSGADSAEIRGPQTGSGGSTGGVFSFVCNLGGQYPLIDPITRKAYRRNPCTSALEVQ